MSTKKQLGTVGGILIIGVLAAMAPVAGQALSMTVSSLAGFQRSVRTRIFPRHNVAKPTREGDRSNR
ncbi:hypothetical protein E3O44_01610 [Cryobacterium algoricola]|uniref:Uncharacterized protein n=1 Tax=Cryobacterium algoricola TaxID=1259183 RepID=A0ABY2IIP3_9MICO|nr:hypothetical protein [Cryobacterium algoricola]TFB90338.1 hypothetical protein E3O44_01610 [Cryobacterium algoricola]